jgi:Mg-chelatase subunit ChlD
MKSYILIDRSGSMQTRWAETIGAVNAYVEVLAAEKKTARKSDVTVAVFDSQEPFKVIRENVLASAWTPIATTEVMPRGMTPLFDAIGDLVQRVKSANPKKASIVIVTDGDENSSREIKKDAAKSLLDELRAKNYDVVFIGADFDAFSQGAGLGNNAGQTILVSSGNYTSMMKGMATRSMAYADTGVVASFTDQERSVAVGIEGVI